MNRKLILIVFLFSLAVGVRAQYTGDSLKMNKYETPSQYMASYFTDGLHLASAPFHWEKKDWVLAGSAVAVGTVIYVFDEDIRNFFQRKRSPFTNNFSKYAIEPFGSGFYSLPLLGILYLGGEIKGDDRSKTIALNGVKTFMLSAGMVTILKQLGKRHRPQQEMNANSRLWDGPFGDSKYTSFPSGHTMASFALASYISLAYKEKKWVAITSYSIATLVGFSRINDDKHWASDVFIGAVLGYAVGKCIYKNSLERYNIQVLPVAYTGLGITLIKKL